MSRLKIMPLHLSYESWHDSMGAEDNGNLLKAFAVTSLIPKTSHLRIVTVKFIPFTKKLSSPL